MKGKYFRKVVPLRLKVFLLTMFLSLFCGIIDASAQTKQFRGTVTDDNGQPLPGVTVYVQGTTNGTITDLDGDFRISAEPGSTLMFSFVGYEPVSMQAADNLKVTMHEETAEIAEVVVVGYGQQKKASVVGSITQTDAKTLDRHSGVPSLGSALTGNLPGVITSTSTGMPGEEDPKIIIRTQTSWNNSDPLVLVDGIERPMNTVDISSVESISVLKDASATAVYGVKGANGVILITTKRGQEGKAQVHVKANSTVKVVSKLPKKYDSYNTFIIRNETAMREAGLNKTSWGVVKPLSEIEKYRNPANDEEWDRYPNVDWQSELFRNHAMSFNATADVSGGTKIVKYFAAFDYTHEGDLFREFSNNRGYTSGFGYNRLNLRSNLDFDLTKTTKFSMNLFGSNGVRRFPWGQGNDSNSYWSSIYRTAPDSFRPVYSDGTYGFFAPRDADQPNSLAFLATSGDERRTTTQINTDFILKQQLDFLLKGLSFKADLSYDNTMVETNRGINDLYHDPFFKWIEPETGETMYKSTQSEDYPYQQQVQWSRDGGHANPGSTYRKLYYSMQLNWDREFGKHAVTALGLFSRDNYATGGEFKHYREDWVFRLTYGYDMKYLFEMNGAYNGSEKFSDDYRFAFFPSFSFGWRLSEEQFVKDLGFVDNFKIRASWGRIGDDAVGGRWLYKDQYAYGGNANMGATASGTPYTMYTVTTLGNPDVHWEVVEKRNLGVDFGFLSGLISGSFDMFNDRRYDILLNGNSRAIPSYFGKEAPVANLGEVKSHGWEVSIGLNKVFKNHIRAWGNFNITHGENEITFADDPSLKANYQKKEGYAINQTHSYIDHGFLNTWDDVIASTTRETFDQNVLPGDYQIVDFNADGVITTDDSAPYQYSNIPQNTYSYTVGVEYKGWALSCQFYGVNRVTRDVQFPAFYAATNCVFEEGTYWKNDGSGDIPLPRWSTESGTGSAGTRYLYDGWFMRLKNAEISYTFDSNWLKKVGLSRMKIYLNGDNLLLWTDMPDDRESNFSGGGSSGAYPTVRRFNIGIDLNF